MIVEKLMKLLILLVAILFQSTAYSQKSVDVAFINDYKDVYHLSLIIYTPDGKNQTRVSDLKPAEIKSYTLPVGTEIFIADWKQEAFAMKGNDIKATGLKPTFVVTNGNDKISVKLSTLNKAKVEIKNTTKE